jgi:hypothetical protein
MRIIITNCRQAANRTSLMGNPACLLEYRPANHGGKLMNTRFTVRHNLLIFTLLLLGCGLFLATPGKVSASACSTSGRNDLWSNKGAWTDCAGGIPTATDTVIINHAIKLNMDATVAGVTISNNGQLILHEKSNVHVLAVSGNVTNAGTLSADTTAGSLSLTGNWVNNGSYTPGSGSITFNGTAAQTIGGNAATSFYNLILNNPAGATLANAQTVAHALTLTAGRLALGGSNLVLGTGVGAVGGTLGASNMIVTNGTGALCRNFSAAGTFTFPIGDASPNYTPATLNFTAGTFTTGQACLRVVNAKHPANPLTTDYLNRYWTVTSSGVSNFSCSVEMSYVQADFTGTDEAGMAALHYHNGAWTSLNPVDAANNKISGTVTGFSDFTAGKVGPTAVDLNFFHAARTSGGVQLTWETVNEATLAGFNLYRRQPGGEFEPVNAVLIPPLKGGQPEGSLYAFLDVGAQPGLRYQYRLEALENTLAVGSSALADYFPYALLLPLVRR